MKTLVLLIGAPGAGKSHYAKTHFDDSYVYISSDDLRAVIGKGKDDQTVSYAVFKTMMVMTKYFLNDNRSVVIDAMNKNRKARKKFLKIGKNAGASVRAVFLDAPLEVCLERNKKRDRIVPEETLKELYESVVPPVFSEGFDYIDDYQT